MLFCLSFVLIVFILYIWPKLCLQFIYLSLKALLHFISETGVTSNKNKAWLTFLFTKLKLVSQELRYLHLTKYFTIFWDKILGGMVQHISAGKLIYSFWPPKNFTICPLANYKI